MKRPKVDVTVQTDDARDVARTVRRAFNGGVRDAEAMVRYEAHKRGVIYEGDRPVRVGGVYWRVWRAFGAPTLVATVAERIEP